VTNGGIVATQVTKDPQSDPSRPEQLAQPISASEEEWLGRARAGDIVAFERIFCSYYDALRDFAEAVAGSPDDAEEAVQEVFLRIWRVRDRWEVHGSLKSYLYGAIRNQVLNQIRDRQTRSKWIERALEANPHPGMGSPEIGADRAAEATNLSALIDIAIERLPTRCRQVFILHRKHGLSYTEIADSLGVSPKTIEKQIARALQQLRDELAPLLLDR